MKTSNYGRTQKSGGPSFLLHRQGFLSSLIIVVILLALIEGYVAAQILPRAARRVVQDGCDLTVATYTTYRIKMLDSEVLYMDSLMSTITTGKTRDKITAANNAICCERKQNELRTRLVTAANFSETDHQRIERLIGEVISYLTAFASIKNPTQHDAAKVVANVTDKRKQAKIINIAIKDAARKAGIVDGKVF